MAAAADKGSTTSLSLFMEACGLEVEEELTTKAIQFWAEGVWTGKKESRAKKKSLDEADSRSSNVEAGERACWSSDV